MGPVERVMVERVAEAAVLRLHRAAERLAHLIATRPGANP